MGLGSAVATPSITAHVTGQQITSSIGAVTTKQTAVVKLDGITLNVELGQANAQAWAKVDTGSTVTYSDVNTGSTVTWTDIAA